MTAEQFAKRLHAYARAQREQEVRNIMAMTGCDHEEAKRLQAWIASGDVEKINAAGNRLGARIGQALRDAFRPLTHRT